MKTSNRSAVAEPAVKDLEGVVAVITGASSGIGRATAIEFARRGASVALASRGNDGLEDIEHACRSLGAPAISQPTDVTSESAVRDLADRAIERFGRIDCWVNNAGVFIMGRFEDTPSPDIRRVIETDLLGVIYGAQAVLPYFRKLGEGVLINVSSLDAEVSQPFAAAYVAAKFGVRGFGKSLRQELRGTNIQVCTVMPAVIDTPLFQHAANFSGRGINAMPPVYPPELAARAICDLVRHPRREVYVGGAARALGALHKVMPGTVERVMGWYSARTFFKDEGSDASDGNLNEPSWPLGRTHGGWQAPSRAPGLLAAGALLAAFALLRTRRPR